MGGNRVKETRYQESVTKTPVNLRHRHQAKGNCDKSGNWQEIKKSRMTSECSQFHLSSCISKTERYVWINFNYRLSLSGFFRLRLTLYTVLATANAQAMAILWAMAIVPAMAVAQQAVANP